MDASRGTSTTSGPQQATPSGSTPSRNAEGPSVSPWAAQAERRIWEVNLPDRETWLASFNAPGAPTPASTSSTPTPPASTTPPTSHAAASATPAGCQQPWQRYQQQPFALPPHLQLPPSRPFPQFPMTMPSGAILPFPLPMPSRPWWSHVPPEHLSALLRTVAGYPPLQAFALPPHPPPQPPHHQPVPQGAPLSSAAHRDQVDERSWKRERQKELGEKQAEIDELLDRSYLNNPNQHSPTKRGTRTTTTPGQRTAAHPAARAPLSTSTPVQQPPRPIPLGARDGQVRTKRPLTWSAVCERLPRLKKCRQKKAGAAEVTIPPQPTPPQRACDGGEAPPAPLRFIPPLPAGTPPTTPLRPPAPVRSPPPELPAPAHDKGGLRAQRPASAPKTSDGACALFSPELLDLNAPCDDSPAEGLRCHESLEIEAFDFRESATDPNAARRASDPVAPATATIGDQAGEVERYTDAIEIDSFLFLESSTRADVVAGGLPWPFDRLSGDGGRGERAAAVEWGEEAKPEPLSLPQPVAKKASSPIRPAAKTIKKRKANAPAAPPLRSGSDGDQEPQKKRRTRSPFKPAVDTTTRTGSSSTATATATAAAMATRRESQQSRTKPQRRRVAADPATCDEYAKLVEIYRAFGSRARDKLASIDDQQRTDPTYTGSLSVTARQMLIDALGELSSSLQTAVGDTTQPAPAVAAASATERRMSVGGIRRRIRALKPVVERLCDAMTWRPPTADTTTPTVATATPTTTATTTTPPASPPSSDSGLSSARTSASTSPSSPPPSFNETVASVPPSPSPSTQRVDTPQLARDLGVLPSFICRPVRLIYDDADDGEEGDGPY